MATIRTLFSNHIRHWAVGHADGSAFGSSKIAKSPQAFAKYHELAQRMADYPILDESDYSERELEATLANITDAAWRVKNDFELPADWESEVYSWLSENLCGEIENRDDQGGYPSESALLEAFDALSFQQIATA